MSGGLRARGAVLVGAFIAATLAAAGLAGAASAPGTTVTKDFESPLFGLATAANGRLLVADAGAGPTIVRPGGKTRVLADLPGVTDVKQAGRRAVLALRTAAGPGAKQALFRVSRGKAREIADLIAFEQRVDPAGDGIDSNPFDLDRAQGGPTYVADAAGNSILAIGKRGLVDWVAVLPQKAVSTQPLKDAVGCPDGPAELCDLPPTLAADPVPTSVEIGPDGYLYVGELIGFPATPGTSRVWRIAPGARHATCGVSPDCSLVKTGPFTSIIDIRFGRFRDPDDTSAENIAYVVELDEASWLALEEGQGVGGTINACQIEPEKWDCETLAGDLPAPTAVAIRGKRVFSTLYSLVPGQAQVARLR
jgi:hypothetical protein